MFERVSEYSLSDSVRFHMPSHNGCDLGINTAMDITELSFSGNLLDSSGIIRGAEDKIAGVYGCKFALMLTCGATAGVSIAVNAARRYGDIIAVVGGAHASLYNSARVQNVGIVTVKNARELTEVQGKVGAVFITSPDYFGNIVNADDWRVGEALIIIDESHGAHFPFSKLLPNSQCHKCDVLISSWHKELPVLTGGAVMVCDCEEIYRQLLCSRKLIHSTSPNYMIMASMDRAREVMSARGEEYYEKVIAAIKRFKSTLCSRYEILPSDDVTRVCISLKGKSGSDYAEVLERQGFYLEMTYNDILVLIVTPFNYAHLERLADVMNGIKFNIDCDFVTAPKTISSKRRSNKMQFVDIREGLGRVCAMDIGMYPPGVPIIAAGDVVNEEVIEFIKKHKQSVFGLTDGLLAVEMTDIN